MPGPIWLQGPIPGIPALLQPVAHSLIEADEDIRKLLATLPPERLWKRRNGAASVAYHVLHAAGSLDRLFTYARGESLSEHQLAVLSAEQLSARSDAPADESGFIGRRWSAHDIAEQFSKTVEASLSQLRSTGEKDLLAPREVGRAKAPSNVLGILVHAADHTYRHVGQAITTAKMVE